MVVRYEPEHHAKQYKMFQNDFSLMGIMRNLRNLLNFRVYKKRFRRFDQFPSSNIKYSCLVKDLKQLRELLDSYDIVIIGSDQTWNLKERSFDEAYLLPFKLRAKKISYASSTGDNLQFWSDEEIRRVVTSLKDFDHVSVRESDAAATFISHGVDVAQVVDPTLLLSTAEWNLLKSQTITSDDEFILYYTVKATDFSVQFVKKLSILSGLKVIAIHPQNSLEFSSRFKRIIDIGPDGFIEYISKAKYVVTTSFHATVFSIIYNKPFLCPTQNRRIVDLLEKLELAPRVASTMADIVNMNKPVDWKKVNNNLSSLVSISEEFIYNAIRND